MSTPDLAGAEPMRLQVDPERSVSALLCTPADPRACFVFAHGAGAGMAHPFMAAFAAGLLARGIASLRFQFPFMEQGSRRTDPAPLAHASVRAAVGAAALRLPGVPLLAGGKSFGGRMSSQAQALQLLPGVRGLVFVGFPLHPAGKPGLERAEHLGRVSVPMLFLQGTRDELADLALVQGVVATLGPLAALAVFADADHGFHVRASSGSTDAATREAMLEAVAGWLDGIALN